MPDQKKAYLLVAAAIFFWSTVASVFKLTLNQIDHYQLVFYGSLSSFLILFAIVLYQRKLGVFYRAGSSGIARAAVTGLINPAIYYLILFKAYDILPAQEAQPLNWTWPLVLSVLSVPLLGQKLSKKMLLALLMSFCGVLVIATRGDITGMEFKNPLGVVLAVGTSVIWAGFWILNLLDKREPLIKLSRCFLFGSIYSFIIMTVSSDRPFPELWPLLGAFYVGLFEMGITFLIWLKALSYARSSASIAIYGNLTPFISLVFIHFLAGEEILISSIAGLTLIIGGILFGRGREKVISDI